MKGRRPQPKSKLRLVGTYRQDRHGDTPDPPATKADCPSWLTENAKAYWPEVTTMLTAMRLNSSHHTLSIALLCDALSDWVRYSELATKEDATTTTAKGNVIQSPIVGLKNKAWTRLLVACREFGMSPSALRGISMPEVSTVDALDRVLA